MFVVVDLESVQSLLLVGVHAPRVHLDQLATCALVDHALDKIGRRRIILYAELDQVYHLGRPPPSHVTNQLRLLAVVDGELAFALVSFLLRTLGQLGEPFIPEDHRETVKVLDVAGCVWTTVHVPSILRLRVAQFTTQNELVGIWLVHDGCLLHLARLDDLTQP